MNMNHNFQVYWKMSSTMGIVSSNLLVSINFALAKSAVLHVTAANGLF